MKSRVTARKWNGDDSYSWAIFIDGVVFVAGLTKSEVAYHKRQAEAIVAKREAPKREG